MKIEQEGIHLAALNLEQIRMNGKIIGFKQSQGLPVSSMQVEMLEMMSHSYSIEQIVNSFLERRILVSFSMLRDLIQFLTLENLILNKSFVQYFSENVPEERPEGLMGKILSTFRREKAPTLSIEQELRKTAFMRSLEPEIFSVFLKNMKIVETPAGVTVCKEGEHQRSLFILLKGHASIYKKTNGKRQRVAGLSEGSVFGEVGFFLGEPRTADVVTDEKCEIVRLKYDPQVFDELIKKPMARGLQKRFWVIHALMESAMFRSLPSDCFDALVFAGDVQQLPENTVLFREGDPAKSFYLVVQGSLVVSQKGQSLKVLGQGDCFGEVALMLNRGKRSATVQVQKDSLVLEIHHQKFYRLLSLNLLLACEFEEIAHQRLLNDERRAQGS